MLIEQIIIDAAKEGYKQGKKFFCIFKRNNEIYYTDEFETALAVSKDLKQFKERRIFEIELLKTPLFKLKEKLIKGDEKIQKNLKVMEHKPVQCCIITNIDYKTNKEKNNCV